MKKFELNRNVLEAALGIGALVVIIISLIFALCTILTFPVILSMFTGHWVWCAGYICYALLGCIAYELA